MSSSLLIAGFDVLNLSSQVILKPDNWDRGAAVPSVAEIQSTVLDGAVVSGLTSGNRQPQMTLLIRGTSRTNLATITNQILMFVNQQSWTMTFTPDGGLPVIFDCYRAATAISSTLLEDAQLTQEITIKCEAQPYGRSPTPQKIVLTGGSVVLDNYTTKPTMAPTVWNSNTSITADSYNGTTGLEWSSPNVGDFPAGSATRTGLSIVLAAATQSITIEAAIDNDMRFPAGAVWGLAVTVGGITYTATPTTLMPTSLVGAFPWTAITFVFATPVPAGTLTGYVLTLPASHAYRLGAEFAVDYMVAYPASGLRGSSTWGNEYVLPFVAGTARAPTNLTLTPPSGTFGQMCVHAPPTDTPDSQSLLTINATASTGNVTSLTGVRYKGTYSVYASLKSGSSGFSAGTSTVTVTQGSASVVLSHTHTAAEIALAPAAHVLLYFGDVTLPLLDLPSGNMQTTNFAVAFVGYSSGGIIGDVLVLDTRGQTVVTDISTPTSKAVFISEPSPSTGFGTVYTSPSAGALTDAVSLSPHIITGAPLWLYPPGGSRLMLWNNTAAPTNQLTYYPRWQQEATV